MMPVDVVVTLVTLAAGTDASSIVSVGDQPEIVLVGIVVPLMTRPAPSPESRILLLPTVPLTTSVPPEETTAWPEMMPPEATLTVPPFLIDGVEIDAPLKTLNVTLLDTVQVLVSLNPLEINYTAI